METLSNSPFKLQYTGISVAEQDLGRLRRNGELVSNTDPLWIAVKGAIEKEFFGQAFEFIFSASSLNFDVNQEVLTTDVSFTADLSFEAGIEGKIKHGNTFYSPKEFNDKLMRIWKNVMSLPQKPNAAADPEGDFAKSMRTIIPANLREFFEGFVVRRWNVIQTGTFSSPTYESDFLENLLLHYYQLSTQLPFPDEEAFVGEIESCLAAKGSSDLSKWQVKIRFIQESSSLSEGSFSPSLFLQNELSLVRNEDEEFDFGSDQIHISNEVLILPPAGGIFTLGQATSNVSNAIGKVANDISETILNIGNNITNNLAGTFRTQLQPVGSPITSDIALWIKIKKGTDDLGFDKFQQYMDAIFCGDNRASSQAIANKVRGANGFLSDLQARRHLPFPSVDAYRSVKVAAEAFVMVNCMVDDGTFDTRQLEDLRNKVPLVNGIPDTAALDSYWEDYRRDTNGMLPYLAVIRQKLGDEGIKTSTFQGAFDTYAGINGVNSEEFSSGQCYGIIEQKLMEPCLLELIWSYWMEESMMVQGLKAILRRFQNIRAPGARDPLANLLIDPLRPLSNLMWGYAQDEQNRLTVLRRSYEYNSHYGISPHGDVLKNMRFADSRSRFMEAFHTLLNLTSKFYRQADDMTVKPDGFPILNALKETHLILSEGAHNQYGDLPFTARTEMLMEQWLLSRSEFREFLPTRIMVAYPEPWMDRVSALNQLMGWTNTSVLHFRDLARFGEQILLSVRFGNWANTNSRDAASNWAQFWREQIQGYIHGYRAVTGVDLTADLQAGKRIDAQQPSVHLRRLLAEQQSRSGSNGFSSNGHGARKRAFADVDEI